jgi:hypothetical protein
MPKYRIRQTIETMNEWEVDCCCEVRAEQIAEETAPDRSFTEQVDYEVTEVTAAMTRGEFDAALDRVIAEPPSIPAPGKPQSVIYVRPERRKSKS